MRAVSYTHLDVYKRQDYAINDKWLVGGEVLYNKFENFANTDVNADLTTIKARVAYRF